MHNDRGESRGKFDPNDRALIQETSEVCRVTKAADAFRTISEVADDLKVPKHVLRFWEVKFPQIKPMKRGGGRRYYRPEDLDLLRGIHTLLHVEGYTIRGVQKKLRSEGVDQVKASTLAAIDKSKAAGAARAGKVSGAATKTTTKPPKGEAARRALLAAIGAELEEVRAILSGVAAADQSETVGRLSASG